MGYNFTSPTVFGKQGRKRGVTVEFQNAARVHRILSDVEDGMRTTANREMRAASKHIADTVLIPQLRRSARSSRMPIAKAMASTARSKSDRIVVVQIGGTTPPLSGFKRGIGAKKAENLGRRSRTGRLNTSVNAAAGLAWGSEFGPFPGADVNTYSVPRREPGGYWVTDGIRNALPEATRQYAKAIESVIVKYSRYR